MSEPTTPNWAAIGQIFKEILIACERQQRELAAYTIVFNTFVKTYPEFAREITESLDAARQMPVLQDKSLAQFRSALERFFQNMSESFLDSKALKILEELQRTIPKSLLN